MQVLFLCLSYCKPSRQIRRCSRGCRRTSRTAGCTRRGGCGRWTPPSCTSWHLCEAFFGSRIGWGLGVEQRGNRRMRISEITEVNLLQSRSSAPSTQSIWPSQCQAWEIHIPGEHSNWPRAHFPVPVFSTTVGVRLASKFIQIKVAIFF